MIRLALLLPVLLLTACDSPSPAMMGETPVHIRSGGMEFSVRIRGTRAEAIRTNMTWNPGIGQIYPHARLAMEQVSGCSVIEDSLRGDTNVMRADLDCE